MTWLSDSNNSSSPGERLAELWRRPEIVAIPGAHNALAALLAKRAGFQALYLSGAALSASLGLPDLGIIGLEELCLFTRAICRAAGLPLIVDADTGFGGILNVMRAVRELEDAGAAAIQIEDQVLPKKCGHLNDKRLIAPDEMAAKVSAAVRARRHLRIIARTDAAGVEGLDAALDRARLYLAAGADAIFPEALTDEAMFRKFAHDIDAPLLANMTEFGRTPYFSAKQFEEFGFKMVIWPVSSLRVAAKAIEDLYRCLADEGSAVAMLDRMQTRAELYETIGYRDFEALDASIAASVLPPKPPGST
ncbi:MAG TPA: methylisocitrate lyase [Candidatus Binataceae bacterium]|nr:methylisocitrate lyase [Candidatus Binataceae bacterium]